MCSASAPKLKPPPKIKPLPPVEAIPAPLIGSDASKVRAEAKERRAKRQTNALQLGGTSGLSLIP